MYFGTPYYNFASPGLAAERSARALDMAMDDIVDYYKYSGKHDDATIERQIREWTQGYLQQLMPGARVTYNETRPTAPERRYRTRLLGYGNCN